MSKYTISKEADAVVEKDLSIIKKIIIKEINPISIILFGGFGRGEGSFEIINRKPYPLNDYDLYIVTKKNIPPKILEKVGIKCSNAIGKGGGEFVETPFSIYDKKDFFHVDLRCLKYSQLSRLKRINRTYELKWGSTVIYGEDVRKKIKDIKVPVSEAFRYLINPACHLILCMDKRRLDGKFKKDEKLYMQHHIIKTYLACASSLLISDGKFKENYRKTNAEFQKQYNKQFPELAKRIDEATKMKIYPHKEMRDIKNRWFQARDDLTFVLSYISKKHLGIKSDNVLELTREIYKKLPYVYFTPYLPFGFFSRIMFPAQYALNILYFTRTRYIKSLFLWRDIGIRISLAAFLLLHSIDNPSLNNEAYSHIRTFYPVKSKNWEDLRKSLLYAFDGYFSQKII
jgi:predicted nucleotidyltransferase